MYAKLLYISVHSRNARKIKIAHHFLSDIHTEIHLADIEAKNHKLVAFDPLWHTLIDIICFVYEYINQSQYNFWDNIMRAIRTRCEDSLHHMQGQSRKAHLEEVN